MIGTSNRRFGAVALPLVMAMMLAGKLAPATAGDEMLLGFAAVIALLGIWAGVDAWRGAKVSNA